MKNDLCDMLTLMRKLDENEVLLPVFLCDGYNKMPPAAGFEVVAEHIVTLMSEITLLRTEVTLLKNENPSNSFIEIKEELKDIKLILNKNPKRDGASASSSTAQGISNETSFAGMLRKNSNAASNRQSNRRESETVRSKSGGNLNPNPTSCRNNRPVDTNPTVRRNSKLGYNESSSHEGNSTNGQTPTDASSQQEWTTVNRRKPRKFITGSKATQSSSFRGVQQSKDIYVGRCDKSVQIKDIEDYVKSEFDITLLKCSCITREESEVKSFKLTLYSEQCDVMLNSNRWPQDVRIRKFYNKFNSNHDGRQQ